MANFRMCSRLVQGIFRNGHMQVADVNMNRVSVRLLTTATETKENSNKEETDKGEKGAPAAETDTQTSTEINQLKEVQDKLQKQLEDIQDKYKRSLAETENVRQRMKKQVDESKLFGIQGFCKDLLDVADVLNKATESVPKEDLNASNTQLVTLFDGLVMTESQLQKVFTRHGLIKISPEEGEKFDPYIHEALFSQPVSEGKTDSTVFAVTKIGYKLHDRTIRPALVGVYKS